MSRLDRHVNWVRNKLAMGTLLKALASAMLAFAFVVLLNILVDRFLARRLPHWGILFWVGFGATIAGALAYSIWWRPSSRQAAIVIDDRLGLKEKFSTALYVRSSTDPFAAAAVRDAEATADNVSLRKRFPVPLPKVMIATIMLIVVTLLTGRFLPAFPLFAESESHKHDQLLKDKAAGTHKMLATAITGIDSTPVLTPADKITLEAARDELQKWQGMPIPDDAAARRSAQTAMADMRAIKDRIKEMQDKALQARTDSELSRDAGRPIDGAGSLGDVSQDIARGALKTSAHVFADAVSKFPQEKSADQKRTADGVARVAEQLRTIANDTEAQKKIAEELKEKGATAEQLKQLAKALEGAANGDAQARQQVGQIANKIAQEANRQQGRTPQQQQAQGQEIQQLVKQMQADANARQTAENMAKAASALARQMAAQAKAGQQSAQPGESVADARAQMQQELQNLQEAADAGEAQQQGDGNNGNEGNGAKQQARAGAPGTWKQGEAKQRGPGSGGPGVSDGGPRVRGTETPVGFRPTIATSVADEKGNFLVSRPVKTNAEKGTSRVALHDVIQSAEKDAVDEVDQDRISRPEQAVVKRYFDDLRQ